METMWSAQHANGSCLYSYAEIQIVFLVRVNYTNQFGTSRTLGMRRRL